MNKKTLQQRISLIMNYDLRKTLNENKEEIGLVSENIELDEIQRIGGATLESLGKALEDVFASAKGGVEILAKDGSGKVLAKDAEELKAALRDGRFAGGTLEKVYVGLLKSERTPAEVIDRIINTREFGASFKETYGGVAPGKIDQVLQTANYNKLAREKMISQYFKDVRGDAAKAGEGALKAGEGAAKTVVTKNVTINNYGQMAYAEEGGKAVVKDINQASGQAIINDAKVIKGEEVVIGGKKRTIKPDNVDGQTIIKNGEKRKTKKPVPPAVTSKLNNKWKWALGLLGGGALAWWVIYQSKKERVPELNDCVMGLVDAGIGTYGHTSGGDLIVIVKQTGDPEMDATGGAYVYMTGRIVSKDGRKRGNWKCKDNGTGAAQVGAADATMQQPINEQTNTALNADVETMIDLLDFPVTAQDLISARALLKKYYGTGQAKTFLDTYQKTGLGNGDLGKTLNFIYTTSAESVGNKDAMMRMYQEMLKGTNVKKGGKLADYLDITWDGSGGGDGGGSDDDKPIPVPKPNQVQYHDCSSKDLEKGDTLEIGCIHPAIKKLQECKLSKGADLGPGGADSKFGPRLSGLLGGAQVIDKSLYDAQMATCATAVTGTTSGTTVSGTTVTSGVTTGDTTAQTSRIADMVKTTDSVNKPEEKTQEVIDLTEKGHELYKTLYSNFKNGRVKPFVKGGRSRIIYKGDLMNQQDLDALNAYIKTLGFRFEKQKDKDYDDDGEEIKYKWTRPKNSAPEPEQAPTETGGTGGGMGEEPAAAQPAPQPQQISENLIKNIVSKHLRSKL